MLATVNRLEMLPAELIRRFDDGGIWFVDLPHSGARYEIFNLHLAKYFKEQFGDGIKNPWSERQWYSLLSDYAGATSAEIAIAVKRCAERAYCEGRPGKIELAHLRYQRTQFVLSSERSSEDIQGFVIKRPLLGLLLGGMGLNLQRESKSYSSIGHLLTRKLECTIDSNSRVLLAPKINSKISAALDGAVQTREVFASYSYYFGRIYLAIA
jgi:SpoVK/Ycf46/Vps4 family AAA+-type ATPase